MAESHVVSGLVAKRSELAGLIDHHRKEIDRLADDLTHVDAAIKIFDPEYDLRTVPIRLLRKRNPLFKSGECARRILDALREGKEPMTCRAMTEIIAGKKGWNLKEIDIEAVMKGLNAVLRRMEKAGTIRERGVAAGDRAFLWEIV